MKRKVLGSVLGVALVVAVVTAAEPRTDVPGPRTAPPTSTPTAGTELIVAPTMLGEKTQVLSIVDPRQRVLCVYHIDLATGKVTLKSARNLQWDLQITNLNNEPPLPEEIRSWQQQR